MSAAPDDLVVLGRIVGSYGVKGWFRIQAFDSANTSNLLKSKQWWLLPRGSDEGASRGVTPRELSIEQSRAHSGDIVATTLTINQPEAAKALAGYEVAISRKSFQAIGPLEYYWVDLVGCTVRNREKIELGQVRVVDDHGAHAFLVVKASTQNDIEPAEPILIPFVASYIDEVKLAERLILVDWQLDWQS